jgi:glycosyltransferase involved in cell wall biosynthesis
MTMKIAQVDTGLPDPEFYRSNDFAQCSALAKLGHDVILFAQNVTPKWQMREQRHPHPVEEKINGFTIRRVANGPELGTIGLTPGLLGQLLKFDYDIINAHTVFASCSVPSTLAALSKRVPLVVTQHDYTYGDTHGLKLFLHLLNHETALRFAVHNASAVIGISSGAVEFMRKFGASPGKAHLVPSSVDTTVFNPNNRNALKEKWRIENNVVLFVGRLESRKAPESLLLAFHKTVKEVPNAKLVIVGVGPEEVHLKELQRTLGLKSVFFLGRLPREEMKYIYPGADIFVLPSLYEPFGNVLLEAMASGLPLIGSSVGGIKDIILHGENGFQITPGNSTELARYMTTMLTDRNLRRSLSESARMTAERKYDDIIIAQKIAGIYRQSLR